jgi:uncharacterized protein
MKQALQPVSLQERIQTIDIIRGFALFGILIINLTVDNSGVSPMEGRTGFSDQLAYWPIKFFMDDRAMAIFCLLFGLGFAIQLQRAEARNAPFVIVYLRRLIALALIGAAHIILIGRDVLFDYALVGFLLLLLHKLNRKLIPVLALLCILIPWTRNTFFFNKNSNNNLKEVIIDSTILEKYVGVYAINSEPRIIITRKGNKLFGEGRSGNRPWLAKSETEFFLRKGNARQSIVKDSSGEVTGVVLNANDQRITAQKIQMDIPLAQKKMLQERFPATYRQRIIVSAKRFWERLQYWSWKNYFWGFNISGVLPLFLLGLYAGRRKIFNEISSNRRFLSDVTRWGLLIGVTGVVISLGFDAWNYINNIKETSYSELTTALVGLSWNLGVIIMALGIIAGLTLLLQKEKWEKQLSFLKPIGRMGLTNYILQSIANIMFFRMLADPDKVGPFWRVILSFFVFAVMILISRWWLQRFRFGPLEWFWRSLTYWKIQPMRSKP